MNLEAGLDVQNAYPSFFFFRYAVRVRIATVHASFLYAEKIMLKFSCQITGREVMRKSIAYRILFILAFLTFLFTLNTVLSGVTNSQVQLSANLMSESFVKLEYEQVKLAKGVGQIELSVQSYLVAAEVDTGEIAETISTQIEQTNTSKNVIADITDEFTKRP